MASNSKTNNTSTASTSTSSTSKKWQDLKTRGLWSLIMIFLFALILLMGHFYCALLVLCIILCIYHELLQIPHFKQHSAHIPYHFHLSWCFFITGTYFLFITFIKPKIIHLTKYTIIYYVIHYHNFICIVLYVTCFLLFIKSLKKGYYRYQFRHFAYVHIIILIFGVCSSVIISNIFNGLFWFLIPASLVIVNDIMAYVWGRMFGKHQLTLLSPKKTIEGFIGALFSTVIWCYFISEAMIKYDALLCPVDKVSLTPFNMFSMQCEANDLRKIIAVNVGGVTVEVRAIQVHMLFFGLFASLVAPFGGLFASGFKRAVKIKDFANTIPGHGGFTDRMDCQILMGLFTFVWVSQFVFNNGDYNVGGVLGKVAMMSYEDKMKVFQYLNAEVMGNK